MLHMCYLQYQSVRHGVRLAPLFTTSGCDGRTLSVHALSSDHGYDLTDRRRALPLSEQIAAAFPLVERLALCPCDRGMDETRTYEELSAVERWTAKVPDLPLEGSNNEDT